LLIEGRETTSKIIFPMETVTVYNEVIEWFPINAAINCNYPVYFFVLSELQLFGKFISKFGD